MCFFVTKFFYPNSFKEISRAGFAGDTKRDGEAAQPGRGGRSSLRKMEQIMSRFGYQGNVVNAVLRPGGPIFGDTRLSRFFSQH